MIKYKVYTYTLLLVCAVIGIAVVGYTQGQGHAADCVALVEFARTNNKVEVSPVCMRTPTEIVRSSIYTAVLHFVPPVGMAYILLIMRVTMQHMSMRRNPLGLHKDD